MHRVAIIGGGITGLSAAFDLERARRNGAAIEYQIFEASHRLGGIIRTERTASGVVMEEGPDSFISAKPWAAELAHEIGLGGELIPSQDARRKTYIVRDRKLIPIPPGMVLMVPGDLRAALASPLFSLATKIKLLGEILLPPSPLPAGQDESVAAFVTRHFGAEVSDTIAAPLLAGIFGGDADGLSARAVIPQIVQAEAGHGSLVRWARKQRLDAGTTPGVFTSFRLGMQQFSDALIAHLPKERIYRRTAVSAVRKTSSGWLIASPKGIHPYDSLIFATPAQVTARLLAPVAPEISRLAAMIHSGAGAAVNLVYRKKDAPLPEGFGVLVPRHERLEIMACTFAHNKFEGRAPQDSVLLRIFFAGDSHARDEEASLLALARKSLLYLFAITAEPEEALVSRWEFGLPQYRVGHADVVHEIEGHLASLPDVHLVGNSYRGVGIPDCVREGRDAANKIIGRAGSQRPRA